ncbi:AtpZ/AtpI family protein [Flavisphingomonas formosensis]|uniref:AtpZ/AtpI family protein n=1 Tax=Flavisphingomonas formosensis TaxID=861534 RepID=UPI0012F79EB3|nr:AtpZ/AtpI family protein [Sphingomonas formosensis]
MAENEPGRDPKSAEDARLASLDERLKAATDAEKVRTGTTRKKPDVGYSQGNRVLSTLIAGPAVGALVGWTLDHVLGRFHINTSPWLLLAFLFLGIAAAFRVIIRISNERPE